MFKLTLTILALVCSGYCETSNSETKATDTNDRHKRLLFFDEDGNLVKTFSNSIQSFVQSADKLPILGSFWKPFYNVIRPLPITDAPLPYMIPISNDVVNQIVNDPVYQNKLLFPKHDLVIEPNPLCLGKRKPIPSRKSCSAYLNCWDGWASEQECPKGLLFSDKGYCDYYDQVECNGRTFIDDTQLVKCNRDFDAFPNTRNCNEFFVCVSRVPIKFKCPADLAYSPNLGVCDYAYKVDCNTTIIGITDMTQLIHTASSNVPVVISKPTLEGSVDVKPPTGKIDVKPSENPIGGDSKPPMTKTSTVIDSWSSTHIAMSRQDAVRQLQLGRIANLNVA